MNPNTAGFLLGVLREEPAQDVVTLTPLVDGQSLVDLVTAFEIRQGYDPAGGYDGIVPCEYRYGDLREYFLGRGDHERERYLLGCSCGDVGCWPLKAIVSSGDDTVTWSQFAQPHRDDRDYTGFGPFAFDRTRYEAALTSTVETLGPYDD